ncbi:uncharacterized protein Triagg1_1687 [Trichoderma aggressivum f. europaeum]|uniref:Ankyrin repeat protein n=1 Tax=Trichoderma aggressivum f. europaeum TaxID=173218 RepID=A0AAE1IHX0_9HYPO|nr:hypothetical protein Triagg1_1687 [Trichoderma aggressivum f. europaeum]
MDSLFTKAAEEQIRDGDMAQPDCGPQRDLMGSIERKDCQVSELGTQLESDRKKYEDNIRQKDEILERQAGEILELRSKEQTERQAKEQAEQQIKEQAEQYVKEKAERRAKEKAARSKARAQLMGNIEAKDDDGNTPLISATRMGNGNADVVIVLLDRGADVDVEDEYGIIPAKFTSLMICITAYVRWLHLIYTIA